jgi:hypothetical protein
MTRFAAVRESVPGPKQTCRDCGGVSAYAGKADIDQTGSIDLNL